MATTTEAAVDARPKGFWLGTSVLVVGLAGLVLLPFVTAPAAAGLLIASIVMRRVSKDEAVRRMAGAVLVPSAIVTGVAAVVAFFLLPSPIWN